jgi:hypothetical protein
MMANKTSIKAVVRNFNSNLDTVLQFVQQFRGDGKGASVIYIYDYAIIKIYKDFEELILNTIIGLINNDASYITAKKGLTTTKSLTKRDAEQLFIGNNYFSFKGRNGLLKQIKNFFPNTHWFVNLLSDAKYEKTFDLIIPLRNFAAHSSKIAKRNAIKAVGMQQLAYSGSWLKVGNRFQHIVDDLKDIALKIDAQAKF